MAGRRRGLLADPRLPYGILVGLALALAAIPAMLHLLGLRGAVVRVDPPSVERSLPRTVPATGSPLQPATSPVRGAPRIDGPPAPGGPPLDILDALLGPGPRGALPRRSVDGRDSFSVYRRAARATPDRPRVALVVVGLGLAREATVAASRLPPAFGLAFSPYTSDLAGWMRYARWLGHEVLLELPVRPARFPLDDAGPLAVGPGLSRERLRQRLQTALAAGKGYFAVVAAAGAYAGEPGAFTPVLAELAAAGLGFVELGSSRFAELAHRRGVPYVGSDPPIDLDPAPEAIDRALGRLETRARRDGAALASVGGTAVAYARLQRWSSGLEARGLQLVAPSLIFENASHRPSE